MPAGGLGIRLKDQPLDKERRLRTQKIPAALAFARANQHRPGDAGLGPRRASASSARARPTRT